MKKILFLFVFTCLHVALFAQYAKVYPTNWWVGMKHNKVQLLIKGEYDGFSKEQVRIKYPGVTITGTHALENGKYIAVDVTIAATAKAGDVSVECIKDGKAHAIKWPLLPRRKGNGTQYAQGVTSSDFIYFLMPDRFSNGDPSNDKIPGMRDQSLNRDSIFLRHGGDMQGIVQHLDYLQKMGVTTLWMTPVLENDMPDRTEHGYAFTDHYKIDARLGGEKAYLQLSDELHKRNMKLIQDAVYNHTGSFHFLMLDPPAKNWFHQWPSYTQTSFKDQPLFDPYASAHDKKITSDGWFTRQMPDLDQTNSYVANFLIQHALWSVEMFGIDGWRIDTYIYNDLNFMNRCNKELLLEYPRLTMFGEAWVHGTAAQAYFADNNINVPFKSNLQGVVDFQCRFYGIEPALMQPFGWTDGVNKLYTTLSNDFLYKDPMRNVVFLDNHDMSRFFSVVKESVAKQKMGIGWLLTTRGIPQMYYGTEILMKGESNPDGWVRLDFPGGWNGDKKNAFTGQNLTEDEKKIQDFTRGLANFRKSSSAIKTGKLMQYLPKDGLYVYFRYDNKQTVMCIMNTSDKQQKFSFSDYTERTQHITKATDVENGNDFVIQKSHDIEPWTMLILELK